METIQKIFNNIFSNLGLDPSLALLVPSQRPDLSDFQINGALSAAKILKKSPALIAQSIIEALPPELDNWGTVSHHQGFINITLHDNFLLNLLPDRLEVPHKSLKVLIDFSGPNIAKSMHVGHLRSTLIGSTLVNLYRYQKSTVISDNHLGDFGTPLGIIITQIQNEPNFDWTLENIEKFYISGSVLYKDPLQSKFQEAVKSNTLKLQQLDPEIMPLWEKITQLTKQSLMNDYHKLNIHFDRWFGESYFQPLLQDLVQECQEANISQLSQGAWTIPLTNFSNPFLLQKNDGGALYQTTDLACLKLRLQEHFDKIIYVVDNRQNLHFQQLFAVASLLPWPQLPQQLYHIGFGTINGPDNKPFKTRSGDSLKLSTLINQMEELVSQKMPFDPQSSTKVAVGALKFAELKHHRLTDYVFDIEKFISLEGYTGPYLMYSLVRGKSVLAKNSQSPKLSSQNYSPLDRELALTLNAFSSHFIGAINNHAPHILCEYAYNLANVFNKFYHQHNILKESNVQIQQHRLALTAYTVENLTTVLNLLGIDVPDKM